MKLLSQGNAAGIIVKCQYHKTCGVKRDPEFAQSLQFGCRDNEYLHVIALEIVDQPLKWGGILDDEFSYLTMDADAYKVRGIYCDPMPFSIANKQQALECRATRVEHDLQWEVWYINLNKQKSLDQW